MLSSLCVYVHVDEGDVAVWRAARLRLRGDARRGYAVHCSARGGVGEEQSAAVDAPSSSRYPSIGQLLDWCSALCDVQVGLLASTAAPVGEGEERTAIATSRSSPPSAAALSSLSSLSCSLSLLSSLSALLEQHFSPIAQRSRQLAVAIKAIAHSTQQQRRGKRGAQQTQPQLQIDHHNAAPQPLAPPASEHSQPLNARSSHGAQRGHDVVSTAVAFEYRIEACNI